MFLRQYRIILSGISRPEFFRQSAANPRRKPGGLQEDLWWFDGKIAREMPLKASAGNCAVLPSSFYHNRPKTARKKHAQALGAAPPLPLQGDGPRRLRHGRARLPACLSLGQLYLNAAHLTHREHMAGARPESGLHACAEILQHLQGDIRLHGACKAAPVHPAGPPPCQQVLG